MGSHAGSTHLAGDSVPPQPPSLTFAVQRHGASGRGGDSTAGGTGANAKPELRVKTKSSIESAPVPLLDTRRGGRSDSGPDLAGFVSSSTAAQAAQMGPEGGLRQGPDRLQERVQLPGQEWRPWQAWGRRWWVRPDPFSDRLAQSGACTRVPPSYLDWNSTHNVRSSRWAGCLQP